MGLYRFVSVAEALVMHINKRDDFQAPVKRRLVEHPQRQETPVSRRALSLMKVFGSYDAASEQIG